MSAKWKVAIKKVADEKKLSLAERLKAHNQMESGVHSARKVGRCKPGAVQAQPRLESARFQNFGCDEEKDNNSRVLFNLKPCFLSLRN